MLFTEGRFFVLLAIAFSVYWTLRSNQLRKHWIVACSCVFYGAWDWRFLILMFASIAADFTFGRILSREQPAHRKKLWVVFSICANLGFLGFFKYYGFFVDSAVDLLNWLGFQANPRTLHFILPAGISFYTFESMSYTIDVYRGRIKAATNLVDFAFFISFFPHLVAGPIVRAGDFLPQLATRREWRDIQVRACLTLFLIGFVKKAVIADNFVVPVDTLFKNPGAFDGPSTWIALCCYQVQIYGDFSGYADMALATAGIFGYRLNQNFDFPHLSTNISEWWRRWHMSLTSWFRDYLFIPMGGSRGSPAKTYFNLYVVFVLCGFWHGASWNFIAFGFLHGTYLVIHRFWSTSEAARGSVGRLFAFLGWPLTTLVLFLSWPLFRSESLAKTGTMYELMFGGGTPGTNRLSPLWVVGGLALLGIHIVSRKRLVAPAVERLSDWSWSLGFGAAAALAVTFVASGYKAFIYFQF